MVRGILFTLGFGVLMFAHVASASGEAGFANGNAYTVTPLFGYLTVECRNYEGWASANYRCRDTVFEPTAFSRFTLTEAPDADEVILNSLWEDGTKRKKSSSFDAQAGMSKNKFNLGVLTLLQRPLLGVGQNQVSYTLKKKGAEVLTGSFTATVSVESQRNCRARTFYSSSFSDCQNEAGMCRQYFDEESYCR